MSLMLCTAITLLAEPAWGCSWPLQRCQLQGGSCAKPHCPAVIYREVNHKALYAPLFSKQFTPKATGNFSVPWTLLNSPIFLVMGFAALNSIPLSTEMSYWVEHRVELLSFSLVSQLQPKISLPFLIKNILQKRYLFRCFLHLLFF